MNNVVVCTGHDYGKFVPILFESIILNTTVNINFFVIYSTITDKDKQNIERIVKQNKDNIITFIPFNFHNELAKSGFSTELPPFRNGYDAYSRLFLPQLLKPFNVTGCIYLDVDTIVNKKFDIVFDLISKTELISGVIDTVTISSNHSLAHERYVNSGVLLMNMPALEKFNFTVMALNYAKEHVNELKLPDQDIINNMYPKEKHYINFIDSCYNMYYSKTSMVKNGVILHFTGPYKPWMQDCRWRLKKCIWVKYKIATKMCLNGKKVTPFKLTLIQFVLSSCRPLFNLILQIRKTFGIN